MFSTVKAKGTVTVNMREDAATALRAVRDRNAVDTRRVTQEVRREITAIPIVVLQRQRAIGKRCFRTGSECIRTSRITHALAENGDARAFIGSQQRGFLQKFGQVSVQRGIPSNDAFQRNAIDLQAHAAVVRPESSPPGSWEPGMST